MDSDGPLLSRELVPLLALAAHPGESAGWTQAKLAQVAHQSPSQISETLRRATKAGLYSPERKAVHGKNLLDFLVHGARFVYFVEPGPLVEGVPTAASHPALHQLGLAPPPTPLVWPCDDGGEFGQAVAPLHSKVPGAALADSELHGLLAALDSIRVGGARERSLACGYLKKRIAGADRAKRRRG